MSQWLAIHCNCPSSSPASRSRGAWVRRSRGPSGHGSVRGVKLGHRIVRSGTRWLPCSTCCTNQRGSHREKPRRRCQPDLGWNADGVAFGFLFFFFPFFPFAFREACQKDSLNLGGRLVDGRSGEALVWSWVTQIPEGNGIGNKGFEGRGRAHGWCGMLS